MAREPHTPTETERLLVADSFHARRNRSTSHVEVRGFEKHINRFSNAVQRSSHINKSDIDRFVSESIDSLEEYGDGFPRFELWQTKETLLPTLNLQLRPLPTLRDSIALKSVVGFARVNPATKGPNIPRFTELNTQLGAEALLTDDMGYVIEGASTSFLFLQRQDHITNVPQVRTIARRDRVWSVTESLVRNIMQNELGWDILETDIHVNECAQYEIWAVNALHGVMRVRSVDDVPRASEFEDALTTVRNHLDLTFTPVVSQSY